MMAVKIIIDRKFKEAPMPESLKVINELRILAMQQSGYISGETLVGIEDIQNVVVLSSWSSFEDWERWENSQDRRKLENELTPHLEEPVKIRPFLLGADAIRKLFAKVVHDSEIAA
jgi:heme-degrading monooxygenase HmoA